MKDVRCVVRIESPRAAALFSDRMCHAARAEDEKKNTLLDSFGTKRDEDRGGQMRNYMK